MKVSLNDIELKTKAALMRHGADDWAAYRRSAISPEPKDWIVFAFEAEEHANEFRKTWAISGNA